jgi:hypothetical protein
MEKQKDLGTFGGALKIQVARHGAPLVMQLVMMRS